MPGRQVVTTRTITREVVPAPTVVARTVPAVPQPLYDEVTPAPIAASSDAYGPPLYDEAVPAAAVTAPARVATPVVEDGAVVGSEPFAYRYVYEPDRILVIDPTTNLAVQVDPCADRPGRTERWGASPDVRRARTHARSRPGSVRRRSRN